MLVEQAVVGVPAVLVAHVGIPVTTYARYERAPGAPECGIPMASAWRIADALGASID